MKLPCLCWQKDAFTCGAWKNDLGPEQDGKGAVLSGAECSHLGTWCSTNLLLLFQWSLPCVGLGSKGRAAWWTSASPAVTQWCEL